MRHGNFGCVHARVENDMRRWWYHAGKVKPLSLSTVLDLLNTIEPVRTKASTIFVAVGHDIRAADEELLRGGRTPWNKVVTTFAIG